ncbi:MAG: GntR family transcriptional regulator [Zoogloeaceae bacterium]|nr:GntR family transcriptional regulator [Zoogloeaceae bacterium]
MPRKTANPREARAENKRSAALGRTTEPRVSLKDLAYEQLEEAIVTLKLPPGAVLSELAMSEMTGIGRTPIREAIQRLAQENLIVVLPQRGLLVAEMDVRKQLRLLETRREVERLICRSAARRATESERGRFAQLAADFLDEARSNDDTSFVRTDREFNELCLLAARNEFAEGAMRLMHGLSRRFWYVHYKQAADLPETARLHANLADAIARGDIDGAGKALDSLLDSIEAFTRATVLSDF